MRQLSSFVVYNTILINIQIRITTVIRDIYEGKLQILQTIKKSLSTKEYMKCATEELEHK